MATPSPPHAPFMGAIGSLDWLDVQLSQVDRGAGGLVIIHGEVGSGRTALLEAFVGLAKTRGLAVCGRERCAHRLLDSSSASSPGKHVGGASWVGLAAAAALQPTVIVIDDLDHTEASATTGVTEPAAKTRSPSRACRYWWLAPSRRTKARRVR